ncbi:MAG: putative DNA binding domain-containing protein [Flexilinea sp.]|nr:putative DNA binding domain-containing protein [Flexilinea sp.]
MSIGSKINKTYTLDYLITAPENKYFDRKSADIKPSDLARHVSAFANADGGVIAIGIEDKSKEITGINAYGETKINAFINAPRVHCKPMPDYQEEFIDVTNNQGKPDRILLLHVNKSTEQIIRTDNDSTWLRIGDSSVEMKGDNLRNLEYEKNSRHYEDELHPDATIEDLDDDLLRQYSEHIGAENMPFRDVLRARGFLKKQGEQEHLTNAAVLLFARNIYQFYPNCRIRFVRYDGNYAGVGTDINIIRDKTIEYPLLKIIDEAKSFIQTQLREFTMLDVNSGKFKVVPEYPEFAWLEGIVNAVTHREYALSGSYIKVSMYDDRLEIESPGKLPNIVTVENIRDIRYSRNPRISRTLTEMGWVRELNEGVKRIYRDMESFFLDDPIYAEPDQSVKLTLKNNIIMRGMRQVDRAASEIGNDVWNEIDDLEKTIITFISGRGRVGRIEIEKYTHKSTKTVNNRLNHLIELGLVTAIGNKHDPGRVYEFNKQ